MGAVRIIIAYVLGVAVAFVIAVAFFTQQVIGKQAAYGITYTPAQQFETFIDNLTGLAPGYGMVLSIALFAGFIVAAIVKRIIKPLAPIAYPVAGAAAVGTALYLIETSIAGGGAGVVGGARDATGFALQCLAGGLGGVVFALARGTPR